MSNVEVRYSNLDWLPVEFTTFSDGCETCEIPSYKFKPFHTYIPQDDIISAVRVNIVDCTRDLMRLLLVKDAIDAVQSDKPELYLDYLPNARADRRFKRGMPHPLKVTAKLINSCNFKTVYVDDTHSDVAEGLIDNIMIGQQGCILRPYLRGIHKNFSEDFLLVAPDLGAAKKIYDVAEVLKHKDYVQGVKIRDTSTGEIVKCDILPHDIQGKDLLMVDDIADGGASFKYLARKLKELGAAKVGLYVTHGIFSKGLETLKVDIDYICCDNLICSYINRQSISDFNNKVGE